MTCPRTHLRADRQLEGNRTANLQGKVAVITGGSSGIGLATAKWFVQEGAYVYITGRRQSELEKAAVQIGDKVTIVRGDVADLADLDALYKKVADDLRRIDIVVANAGFVEWGFLPTILVASCVHLEGIPQYTVYGAAKAALRSFARSWALELKGRAIRVNSLSPGATDTPIVDGQFKSAQEAAAAKKYFSEIITLGRLGRPDELASAAYFLASDESSYMTGADLIVDGGWTQV